MTGTPTAAGLMAAPPEGGVTTLGLGDVVAMEVEGGGVDDMMTREDEGVIGMGRIPSMNSVKCLYWQRAVWTPSISSTAGLSVLSKSHFSFA